MDMSCGVVGHPPAHDVPAASFSVGFLSIRIILHASAPAHDKIRMDGKAIKTQFSITKNGGHHKKHKHKLKHHAFQHPSPSKEGWNIPSLHTLRCNSTPDMWIDQNRLSLSFCFNEMRLLI